MPFKHYFYHEVPQITLKFDTPHFQKDYINKRTELPQDSQYHQSPFLDCLVKRNFDKSLDLAIYRKPIHSNRFIYFNSAYPFSKKIFLALNLSKRAIKIIIFGKDKLKEKGNITIMLSSNNFPKNIGTKLSRGTTVTRLKIDQKAACSNRLGHTR